jgi:hypothetical protein
MRTRFLAATLLAALWLPAAHAELNDALATSQESSASSQDVGAPARCTFEMGKRAYHFPVMHWDPLYDGRPDRTEQVARSQHEVATLIQSHPELEIFEEDLFEDLTPEKRQELLKTPSSRAVASIRLFPDGIPSDFAALDAAQREHLAREGASKVLFHVGKLPRVRKTISRAESRRIDAAIEARMDYLGPMARRHPLRDPELTDLIVRQREALAHAELSLFLGTSDRRTLLVYGAHHQFATPADGLVSRLRNCWPAGLAPL